MRRTTGGRTRRCSVLAALAFLVSPAALAVAWDGERPPNDPGYDIAERQPAGHTFHDEQWFMYSFIPRTAPLASDPEGAAGMSIDRAWRRYGTGRPDVRVAYIEGGVNWRDQAGRRELAPRSYLNTGELPLPAGTSRYDANGDGQVNVADYAGDPRIRRPYLHGEITPEDLILAFSDGRDGDHNGYADDIAGWNFFRGDNDPQTEDSAYTHADDQMRRAVAEGDNGYAGVGICPHCTVIPIKAGAEALVRPDRLAQSIFFAVDSGASVVVAVVAELGYTPLVRQALDYAWRKGVVVVEASNDFGSADHQSGMFWPRVWPGNALVADTTGTFGDATAGLTVGFRDRSNYTSFGPHSLFSMPTLGGTTSEATPTQGGVAALMAAYGRKAAGQGLIASPLAAGEIKQVLRAASSPAQSLTAYNHPGRPGATFSLQYGYGRPNVDRALGSVLADRIPPVPDILAPSWYAIADPTRTASVPVVADIRARRARRFTWAVQWALGAEPAEADFRTLRTGTVAGRRITGRLAALDLSRIPRSFWERPLEQTADLSSTEQHTVTLRVQATDERGLMGEDRRAFTVVHDPSWRPGFPRFEGLGKESPPVPADITGDGAQELVFGDGAGAVHAVDGRGRELPGWPARTRPLDLGLQQTPAGRAGAVPFARDPVATPVAVGDLDGDGRPEVVATSLTGRIYAFDAHGRLR
ncbi:MAG: cell wall-associated protease, partial [Miltoncostaeaceae bacterium]|nr:cell wall-associated protease [Miltoncostaeaceae bacterium]